MTNSPVIRIQLVDDHDIVRAGFRSLLEKEGNMQVVAESSTGKEACSDFNSCKPDIVIMDVSLPDISGLEAMRRILHEHPEARVLILSMHTGMVAERALQLGAQGFVCKSSRAAALLVAIDKVMQGERFLNGQGVVQQPDKPAVSGKSLTKREIEVCLHLSEGKSISEVADILHLSEKTVYSHRQHIMEKLGVSTSVELARVATRMGILG